MRGRRFHLRSLIKLLVICLVVGFALSLFGIEPMEFWRGIWSVIVGIYDWLVSVAGKLVAYVVIGACVVIPILVIRWLWRRASL